MKLRLTPEGGYEVTTYIDRRALDRLHAERQQEEAASPRRSGRPRGPERVKITVRITEARNAKLTQAVDQTGQPPQDLVEQALDLLFSKLRIRDEDIAT